MALAYRVNINICPLLNTFYCKCVINATRFKSQLPDVQKTSQNHSGNVSSKHKSFTEMITYRQNQAHKSIIVKVHSFNFTNQLYDFCSQFGEIVNIFPYTTKTKQCFLLLEFSNSNDITALKKCTSNSRNTDEGACLISPLFMYPGDKHKIKPNVKSSPKTVSYLDFAFPTESTIRNVLKPLKTVPEQMNTLYNVSKVSELDVRLRFYTAELLTYYLSRLFINIFVVPFGSSVNGFGLKGCDLDLLCKSYDLNASNDKRRMHFFSQHVNFNDRSNQQQFLETVYMLIKTCIPGIAEMKSILNARVPILKFVYHNTNMQCDLSSTNTIALYMSEMLYMYGEMDNRVRPLVCTIRKWAQVHQITVKHIPGHWITNFSLTLLVIFYLQKKNILPSLNNFKTHTRFAARNNESLDQLLYGFFDYYSKFDFKVQAICIREGQTKEKKDNSPLYIYNPFETSLNVSKNINHVELARIVHSFQGALQTLVSNHESDIILNLLKYTDSSSSNKSRQKDDNHNVASEQQAELFNEDILNTDNSEKVTEIIK